MRSMYLTLTVIVGLALAVPAAVPSATPGLWTLHNATFAPAAAVGGTGFAFRVQTTTEPSGQLSHAWANLQLPDGFQVEDIKTLYFFSYVQAGGCGGGSPRWSLHVDTDGDGAQDASVYVYAGPFPSYAGCPLQTWEFNNLLDGNLRWDSSQLGGPFYGNQSTAQALAGSTHEVLSASVVWDSTWLFGDSIVWLDELRLNCYILGEPAHLAISLASVCPP